MKYAIKKLLFCLLVAWSQTISCQEKGSANTVYKSSFVPKTQIYFNAGPNFYNRLDISHEGEGWLKSRPGLGATIGLGLYRRLANRLGITMGVDANVIPFNYRFDFSSVVDKEGIGITKHQHKHTDYMPYVGWNLGIQYLVPNVFEKYDLQLSLGFRKNTIPTFSISSRFSYFIEGDDQSSVTIFESEIRDFDDSDELTSVLASYYSKVGLHRQNNKHNTVAINFVFHYTPKKITKGVYSFYKLDKESHGALETGINYIGLEFVYGITFLKPK